MEMTISADTEPIRRMLQMKLKRTQQLPEGMFRNIATVVYQSIQKNFRAQGRPKPWQALSPLTLFIRQHRAEKRPSAGNIAELQEMGLPARPLILQDSGHLRQSLAFGAQGNVSRHEIKGDTETIALGTNLKYAATQHFGGVSEPNTVRIAKSRRTSSKGNMYDVKSYVMHLQGGKRIPARPFMMIQEEDNPKIFEIMARWVFGTEDRGI